MKLLMLMIAGLLAAPSVALADNDDALYPPGGPVYESNDLPDAQAAPQRPMQGRQRGMQKQLKRALVEQFDMNGDGRLGPRERMRAIRVLRRIEQKLANGQQRGQRGMPGQPGMRGQRGQRFIERFDTNGDGNVGPQEMPRGAARKLRRFDRDHDGWLEPNELRR